VFISQRGYTHIGVADVYAELAIAIATQQIIGVRFYFVTLMGSDKSPIVAFACCGAQVKVINEPHVARYTTRNPVYVLDIANCVWQIDGEIRFRPANTVAANDKDIGLSPSSK
jgi:hypothetical protein